MFGSKRKRQKELQERAEDLVATLHVDASLANKTKFFSIFMEYYDEMLEAAEELCDIYDSTPLTGISGNPKSDYYSLKHEAQWHMRDALERNYDEIIENSKKKYRNNLSMTKASCSNFQDSIEEYRDRFDEETEKFANDLLKKLFLKFNINVEDQNEEYIPLYTAPPVTVQPEGIYFFDELEGHEFEHWCANLLRYNGFENVEVTQDSGDQGVDIIAEKDDINYAIQCKCYTSDLGNKPVQEVFAGKDYYHCQIGAVMTNRYFTKSAKDLAKSTGVLLWDRDRILKFLNSLSA